jgi:hypothetical protein
MQYSLNSISEPQQLKQVKLSHNAALTTFLIPEANITLSIITALTPDGLRTSVEYILPYKKTDYQPVLNLQFASTHQQSATAAYLQQQHRQRVQLQFKADQQFLQQHRPQIPNFQFAPAVPPQTQQPSALFTANFNQQQPAQQVLPIDLRQPPIAKVIPRKRNRKNTKTTFNTAVQDQYEYDSNFDPTSLLEDNNPQSTLGYIFDQLPSTQTTDDQL